MNDYIKIVPDYAGWDETLINAHYKNNTAAYIISNRKNVETRMISKCITPITKQVGQKIECAPIHRKILISMMEKGFGDNEYAAFCIALKWAVERLKEEQIA